MAQVQPKNDACEPIGRILKTNQQNLVGKLLCNGDQIVSQIKGGMVLCYFSGSEQPCQPKKQTRNSRKKCPLSSRSFCKRIKGGQGSGETPRIITPYGRWLLETRPSFTWLAVPGATKYQLEVADQEKGLWSITTTSTSAAYPTEQAPLSSENHYKVSVVAYRNDVPIVADSSIFRLLDSAKTRRLQQTIQLIRRLNLDPDQEAYLDLNAAYLDEGLLNQSIKALRDRVQSGSNHPEIFRVLAERYIDAKLLSEARKQYLKAKQLAKAQGNQIALKKATEGLQALDRYQSQLPERKNEAQ
ncbi:hypothetical protein AM1_F0125 (plasmid) [Acaryochloris marina MBIC11017]|uniref:Uncharacterized protein n=2 Tax=Acaryochloris marina TaxID=155978 RepID=A8ZPR9_ACAM1|nr:hypothetical protein AM1_F0125 [Acaryochloris marina MBIC11017]